MRRVTCLLALAIAGAACSGGQAASRPEPSRSPAVAAHAPSPSPSAAPTPALPPYFIESLRIRSYPGGRLQIGDEMLRGPGFTKHHMTWPSGGQAMTVLRK